MPDFRPARPKTGDEQINLDVQWDSARRVIERLGSSRAGIFFMVAPGTRGVDGIGVSVLIDEATRRRWLLVVYVQTKLALLRDANFRRIETHPSINIRAVAAGLHLAHKDWRSLLSRQFNVSESNILPVFVLQTCKKVNDVAAAERLLASSEERENADESLPHAAPVFNQHSYNTRQSPATREALRRCIEKELAEEEQLEAELLREAEASLRAGPNVIHGCSCVMDQDRMYGNWDADVIEYAKTAKLWPEYMAPPDDALPIVTPMGVEVDPWEDMAVTYTKKDSGVASDAAAASAPSPAANARSERSSVGDTPARAQLGDEEMGEPEPKRRRVDLLSRYGADGSAGNSPG